MPAAAHGVGERHDLPVPLTYYLAAAAIVVALTFALAAVFLKRAPAHVAFARVDLRNTMFGRAVAHSLFFAVARLIAVIAVLLVIVAGLFGDPHPAKNMAPTFVWIVWWVAVPLFVALVGDIWSAINPWQTIYRATASRDTSRVPDESWTEAQVWPAFFLLFAFVWIEVVWSGDNVPASIALGVAAYSAFTLLGLWRRGEAWLRQVEPFTVMCRVLGRFAPIQAGPALRQPGAALLSIKTVSPSLTAFIVLMLSAVLFDGLLGTRLWRGIEHALYNIGLPWPYAAGIPGRTLGLLGTWLVLAAAFAATCWIMSRLRGAPASAMALASRYAMTLVPIAVGYAVAHNLAYVINELANLPNLLLDPFGWRGIAGAEPPQIVGSAFAWYAAITAIVVGHVIAVLLAHVVALDNEGDRRRAVIRLIPMTMLMVAYTVVSLFVLAEPLVRFRSPDPTYSLAPPAGPALAS